MNNNKKSPSDKKILIKFIGIVLIWAIVGGIVGYSTARYDVNFADVLQQFSNGLVKISPYLMVITLLVNPIIMLNLSKGKKYATMALSTQEENLFEKADQYLDNCMALLSISLILCMTLFGVSVCAFTMEEITTNAILGVTIGVAVLVITLVVNTYFQKKAIDVTKVLYPEKKGNPLDTKFQKQWLDSCDEAEKALIGKAAYKSYVVLTYSFLAAFLILVVLSTVTPMGPLPMIIVGVLWLIQTTSYIQAARK